MPTTTGIDSTHADYRAQVDEWNLAAALWGGTFAMRAAGKTYLPQFAQESDVGWEARRDGAVLFNAYRKTVCQLGAKPFAKPVVVGDDVPKRVAAMLENVDLEGTALDVFARRVFELGVRDGKRLILVDYPRVTGRPTAAIERESRLRPYWVEIDARRVIGWKSAVRAGRRVLTQLRITEDRDEPVGDSEFETQTVHYIRVYDAGAVDALGRPMADESRYARWRLFRELTELRNGTQFTGWVQVDDGPMPPQTDIPIAVFLPRRRAVMVGDVPLLDLAHLNVAHWQSDADQTHILHSARVPTRVLLGFDEQKLKDGLLVVGGSKALYSGDVNAKAFFLEHTGAAITSGAQHLEALENRMRVLGLEFLVRKPLTATEDSHDERAGASEVHAWSAAMKDTIENALAYTAIYADASVTDARTGERHGGQVSLFGDFGIDSRDSQEIAALAAARAAREITQETFLNELKRRGVLIDDLDVDAEVQRTGREQDALARAFETPDAPDDDEEEEEEDDEAAA